MGGSNIPATSDVLAGLDDAAEPSNLCVKSIPLSDLKQADTR